MRKKAISYIRFSTSEQALGDSYRRQYDATVKYCQENNLELDESFYDEGISAFKGSQKTKGKFGLILSNIEAGTIAKGTTLIVESIDRMSRETVLKQMSTFIQIIEKGITIVTLLDRVIHNEDTIEKNPSSLMMTLGAMHRANEESETKSKRLSAAWDNKRKNISPDNPLTSILPSWLKINNQGQIEIIKDRAKVVSEIYELSLSGLGRRAITKQLNQRKIPIWSSSKRNKSGLWTDSYIQKILSNKAVMGEFTSHKKVDGKRIPSGKTLTDYYPQVIGEKLFWAVQHRVSGRTNKGGRGVYKAHNLFSSLLYCNKCGSKLVFLNKGHNEKYFACQKARNGICTAKNLKYEHIEAFVLQELLSKSWKKITTKDINIDQLQIELDAKKAALSSKEADIQSLLDSIKSVRTSQARETLAQSLDVEAIAKNSLQSAVEKIKGSIAASTVAQDKRVYTTLKSGSEDTQIPLRRKLKSLINENVKLALVGRSKEDSISIIMLMSNDNLVLGNLSPKMNKRFSCTLEDWHLNQSISRSAIGYDLELIDGSGIDAILKPKLISFSKGVDAVCHLTDKQSAKMLSHHIDSSPSKTKGIRKINSQVKLRFQKEMEDYHNKSPKLAVEFSTFSKIKSGKLWLELSS